MKKEAGLYLIAVLLLGVVFLLSFFPTSFTGHAVLEQYENESSCVDAGYIWNNITEENCTTETVCVNETVDCEPCLEYEIINETTNETGDCLEWSSCIEENCTEEETCEDVVVGGECIGDVCDADNLDLCLTSEECDTAGGYWYDANDDETLTCNVDEEPLCSNDLSLCDDETSCTDAGGYWYDDACNADECGSDTHCDEGFECNAGVCEEITEETTEETTEVEETEETEETTETESAESGESSITTSAITPSYELSLGGIQSLSLSPLESKSATITASNDGNTILSTCSFSPSGDETALEWITYSEDSFNLNQGDQKSISFDVNIPENAEAEEYNLNLLVECAQTSTSSPFVINVVPITFEFNLNEVRKIRSDEVRVSYVLTELANENQSIEMHFALKDNQSQIVSEVNEINNLTANLTEEFETILPVNESVEGNLTLQTDINSQIYSSSVEEPVVLGAPPLLGFVALGDVITTTGGLIVLVFVVMALAIIVLVARHVRKTRNLKK